ncbi:F-box only protein 15 isoform X1 [Oryzias latipes]|uniref:F-box only protein 15 isoform X1 n=1 Tax=Oryzias latipes TaxID=8090 RepID=UPI000CE2473A|nr:F-box only protein 15 isoform X1 [Oryzias latipes]
MATHPKVVASRSRQVYKKSDGSLSAFSLNFLERLPCEIVTKVLSYLDAPALFSMSYVNKRTHQLASDNALWKNLYVAQFGKNKRQKPPPVAGLNMEVKDPAAGYWKRLFLTTVEHRDTKTWKQLLGHVSCLTGLPSRTEQVLSIVLSSCRNSHVTWELTVTSKSGQVCALELSRSQFCKTSLTLCWSGGLCLSNYGEISTLQLDGVRRIELNHPGLKKRSLMAKLNMQPLTKCAQVIGQDRLVQLKLLQPGVIMGLWTGQSSVAFFMFTLHFHKLMERSTHGSAVCPYTEPIIKPPFDDVDPDYGLHGYQVHIVLHNTTCQLLSESFSQLFCPKDQISDGFIHLTAISRTNLAQHTPVLGSITLPWQCEALQGSVENCCVMSFTLLDEFRKPFKCVCSPVSMQLEKSSVCLDYSDEHFLIHHKEPGVQVKMQLAWSKEQEKFVLISLVVCVSVHEVNKHFSRDY